MASTNNITGDSIRSKTSGPEAQQAYADAWERTFGKGRNNKKEEYTEPTIQNCWKGENKVLSSDKIEQEKLENGIQQTRTSTN